MRIDYWPKSWRCVPLFWPRFRGSHEYETYLEDLILHVQVWEPRHSEDPILAVKSRQKLLSFLPACTPDLRNFSEDIRAL